MQGWGKPTRLRVDNGQPWGRGQEVPSPLALWLMGLGVEVVWIPPRKPQVNGVVERAQGVLQRWAEPRKWSDLQEGQKGLEWAIWMQREGYRGADGKTRMERFPGLRVPRAVYRPGREEEEWSLQAMDQRLATGRWMRKVNKKGQISLYNWAYSVGQKYARQKVFVRWDAGERVWRVEDERGEEIKRLTPRRFDAEAIRSLSIACVKPSRRGHKPVAEEGVHPYDG